MVGGGHRVSVIQRVEDSHALHDDDDDDDDDRIIKTMSSSNGLRGKCVFPFFQI